MTCLTHISDGPEESDKSDTIFYDPNEEFDVDEYLSKAKSSSSKRVGIINYWKNKLGRKKKISCGGGAHTSVGNKKKKNCPWNSRNGNMERT
ncbi:unnamed protein product [Ambrosiozyma monospora]|uniref:Unnamed protein product n=1 Tax=Ambrosiozyma monospora TaxID=43982 RepID=A0ACB5TAW7_AMBMO|nr:unnamed protein product [Ambrosiozyma monospora]